MPGIQIRAATKDDLPHLTEIYNRYVVEMPITFDLKPWATEERVKWFEQFATTVRYRLLVADEVGPLGTGILGYAGTTRFRPKAAYDTTVETTIYCAPEVVGKGVGSRLYNALFETISGEAIHRLQMKFREGM